MCLLHRAPAETTPGGGFSRIRAIQGSVCSVRVQLTRRCGVLKSRRAVQETIMKLSEKMMAAAAFAALLMPAFNLRAEAAEKLSATADPAAALPSAPMPADSTTATAPYSEGRNFGTPKAELFLGYSYLQAVPKLADGNRLVWLNGGSTSIAFNFNRYFGVVGDLDRKSVV